MLVDSRMYLFTSQATWLSQQAIVDFAEFKKNIDMIKCIIANSSGEGAGTTKGRSIKAAGISCTLALSWIFSLPTHPAALVDGYETFKTQPPSQLLQIGSKPSCSYWAAWLILESYTCSFSSCSQGDSTLSHCGGVALAVCLKKKENKDVAFSQKEQTVDICSAWVQMANVQTFSLHPHVLVTYCT